MDGIFGRLTASLGGMRFDAGRFGVEAMPGVVASPGYLNIILDRTSLYASLRPIRAIRIRVAAIIAVVGGIGINDAPRPRPSAAQYKPSRRENSLHIG